MHKVSFATKGLIAIVGLVTATAAEAKSKEEGWKAWAERATAIDAALKQTDSSQMKAACSGVTGTVIGQGFQFPYWGQSLIRVCQVSKDLWLYTMSRRGQKKWCSDIKDVAKTIGKATPVAEGPGAAEIALDISATMMLGFEQACKK
ncbi:MAG: hypothetical protein J0J06_15880 [Sphingomonas sp.]|uniref:hypothetical protein n=1 Tax=Sphingomonas sp. TaxID=28214 RepID=UPI001ACB7F07|nr:hypothetical protein [Sphingomonas sp.]MBN8816913.1 hypothetical protein [Sphingomonas sp.]